jgi:FK506-binding protein 4/5
MRQRMGFFRSQIERVMHKAVGKMRVDDAVHVSFEIEPAVLDESDTAKSNGVSLDLKFEVRLVEIESCADHRRIHEQSAPELYATAVEHKGEANSLYAAHFVRTAFQRYHRAISFVIVAEQLHKQLHKDDDDEQPLANQIQQLKSQIYGNMAACQLATPNGNARLAIVNATKCMEVSGDANNVKALFRRAKAYARVSMLDESMRDIQHALKLESNNAQLKELLVTVERQKKAYASDMSAKLKKMFA